MLKRFWWLVPMSVFLGACTSSAPNGDDAAGGSSGTGGSGSGGSSTGSGGSAGSMSTGGSASGGTSGGSAGSAGSGGTATGGSGGTGGSAGSGSGGGGSGGGGSGGMPGLVCNPWPAGGETVNVDATIEVDGTFDGEMKRYVGVGALGSGGQDEDQPAFFRLAEGSVLKNVVLPGPAADGVHCDGPCRIENVWWEDVGEDAATFRGDSASQVMTVECAGARAAADKIFQHNGAGTLVLRDIYVEDFGKVYRSCGNCSTQYERHVELENIFAEEGNLIVGLNENYGDTATFTNINVDAGMKICERYQGNDTGAEPFSVGEGPDGTHCLYESSDIHTN